MSGKATLSKSLSVFSLTCDEGSDRNSAVIVHIFDLSRSTGPILSKLESLNIHVYFPL